MIYMDSRSANDGSYTLNVTFDVGTAQTSPRLTCRTRWLSPSGSCRPMSYVRVFRSPKRQPQPLLFLAIKATDPRYD